MPRNLILVAVVLHLSMGKYWLHIVHIFFPSMKYRFHTCIRVDLNKLLLHCKLNVHVLSVIAQVLV